MPIRITVERVRTPNPWLVRLLSLLTGAALGSLGYVAVYRVAVGETIDVVHAVAILIVAVAHIVNRPPRHVADVVVDATESGLPVALARRKRRS